MGSNGHSFEEGRNLIANIDNITNDFLLRVNRNRECQRDQAVVKIFLSARGCCLENFIGTTHDTSKYSTIINRIHVAHLAFHSIWEVDDELTNATRR